MIRAFSHLPGLLCFLIAVAMSQVAHADPVDDYIRMEMQKRHIPGLALAVVQNGKSVKLQGYGFASLELQLAVTPDTVFQLASVTKQFTAAGIMLLVQDGKLKLDDTLGKVLKDSPEDMKPITIKQLLTHTSGLPREGPLGSGRSYRDDIPEEDLWRGARKLKLEAEPGERFGYSNLGFNTLGLVIERVSGMPYAKYMKSRIFTPLGMSRTQVNDLRAVITNRACGYEWENGTYKNGEPISPTTYSASGSIVSSAADMEKWVAALASDKLLTAKSRETMWTPMVLNNGKSTGYGFAWSIGDTKGHHHVSHDGLLSGFRSYIVRYTEDQLTVIVLTNQSSLDDPGRIARGVAAKYITYLKEDQPAAVAGKPELFPDYTGRYEFSNNVLFTVTIDKESGQLTAHLPPDGPDIYKPISDTGFYCYDEDIQLTFVRDKANRVTGVKLKQNGNERTIPRINQLVHLRAAEPDPEPAFTLKVEALLETLGKGGVHLAKARGITTGARKDFAASVPDLQGITSLTYVGRDNVEDQKIERHGGKVQWVNTYKLVTASETKYILVYITADKQVTDEDIVED